MAFMGSIMPKDIHPANSVQVSNMLSLHHNWKYPGSKQGLKTTSPVRLVQTYCVKRISLGYILRMQKTQPVRKFSILLHFMQF